MAGKVAHDFVPSGGEFQLYPGNTSHWGPVDPGIGRADRLHFTDNSVFADPVIGTDGASARLHETLYRMFRVIRAKCRRRQQSATSMQVGSLTGLGS
ncbi:MAG: hypothetical protein ACOYD0_08590 [Candidatus Nanopelagicales bacterium]